MCHEPDRPRPRQEGPPVNWPCEVISRIAPGARNLPNLFIDRSRPNELRAFVEQVQQWSGVYYGYAQVREPCCLPCVQPCVLSIGFNPTFGSEQSSIELIILRRSTETNNPEWVGKECRVLICGFIRREVLFTGPYRKSMLDRTIKEDIQFCRNKEASDPEFARMRDHPLFY